MRIHFVINPRAGHARRSDPRTAIREAFPEHCIRISSNPATIWRDSASSRPDLIVAAGGDGTVNRVINAVSPERLSVGILPCGSSNDLARALGIPRDLGRACAVIRRAALAEIDLIAVNGTYFATCGGIGFAAAVAERANRWRNGGDRAPTAAARLGRAVYPAATLAELLRRREPFHARLCCAEWRHEASWAALLISNQPHFGGFCVSPEASNQDGFLDLCEIAPPSGRARMAWISLQAYRRRADTCAEVRNHRTRSITIVAKQPVPFFGDGEILCHGRRFHIAVTRHALRVVVPSPAEVCHG